MSCYDFYPTKSLKRVPSLGKKGTDHLTNICPLLSGRCAGHVKVSQEGSAELQ